MRILIDTGHPSDIHLFRNFSKEFELRGHTVLFAARNKEVTYQLLENYKLNFIKYGNPYNSILGKFKGLILFETSLLKIAKKFEPDLFFAHGSFYSAHVALFMRKPFITFEDTGNMEQIMLFKPFSDIILTPDSFSRNLGRNHIRFNGTKELAYLHPTRFNPNRDILKELQLESGQKFVIVRFVGWHASHDIGHQGISNENKSKIVEELSKYARVFISSELPLPNELLHLKLEIAPEKLLDAMYYAELLFGESATMASECALMGTPSIFVNNARICYTLEQESKYGLTFNFTESEEDQKRSLQKAIALLQTENLKEIWKEKSKKMMKDQIDVTAFMVWLIENYPDSRRILKENPAYMERFKY